MKLILGVSFWLVLLLPSAFAQEQDFKLMMDDYRINVNDVIEVAEQHFDIKGREQGSGYNGFSRWRERMLIRFPDGDRSAFNPLQAYTEYNNYMARFASRGAPGSNYWVELGPDNTDDLLGPSWAPGVGRVEAVAVDTVNSDTIYMGSRMGGFWKTVNGGTTWYSTTQDLPAVGVIDIEVHPVNRNEIWTIVRNGTGYSLGLMKSVDYGETWNTTSLTFAVSSYTYLYDLIISRANPNIMYCSSNDGLYKSTDGGANWNLQYAGTASRIALKPFDPNYIYMVDRPYNSNVVRYSTNGGATWNDVTIAGNAGATLWLGVTDANPSVIYAASNNGIWKSVNSGLAYTLNGPAPNSLMAFGVSSTDVDRVICGGLNVFMSTDAGVNFNQICSWLSTPGAPNYVHADSRVIKSWNGVFYHGTDGFLGKSTDGGTTWDILNRHDTPIREFYCIGNSTMRAGHIVGGSQDNGTSVLRNGIWSDWIGADGMECHFDRSNPKIWFGTIQNGVLRRTTADGNNSNGIAPDSNGNWVTPSTTDPSNDNTLFIGYQYLYKTMDNGTNWQTTYDFTALGSNLDLVSIAESDSNRLYVVENTTNGFYRSDNNGVSWTNYYAGLPTRSLTDIAIHPENADMVAVSFGGFAGTEKVFISANGGVSWSNISSNLPNVSANTLIFEGNRDNRIYLGMDVGVYFRDNTTGGNWLPYQDSLPLVEVSDLEIHRGANLLQAGTYGRGAWKAPLWNRGLAPQIIAIDMDPNNLTRPTDHDAVNVEANIIDDGVVVEAKLFWGTDGTTFPNVIGMSMLTPDSFLTDSPIPAQPLGTRVNFKIMAVDNTADTTYSDKIVYRVKEAVLCTAAGSGGTGADYISGVELHSIANIPTAQSYYADYSSTQIVELWDDSTYQLKVTLNFHWNPDTVYAWVDWNNNLYFDDNELIVMSELNASHQSFGTIAVPPTAVFDDTLVMRVRNIYSNTAFADPCNSYFGEVEDYGIVARSAALAANFDILPNPACIGDSVYFSNLSVGANSYAWMVTNGTDTMLSTAINPAMLLNTTGTYTARLIASDGFSSDTLVRWNNLVINGLPVVTANASVTNVCEGESIILSGGGAASYIWDNGATNGVPLNPAISTLYTVTGADLNGCTANASVMVNVVPFPAVTIATFFPDTVCSTTPSVALPAGTPAGGAYSGVGVAGVLFYPILAGVGTHTVTYQYNDVNNCSGSDNTSIVVEKCIVVNPAGINEVQAGAHVHIYPNPTNGLFSIKLENISLESVGAKITDMLGKEVWIGKLETGAINLIDITDKSSGLYFLHILFNQSLLIDKIMKE